MVIQPTWNFTDFLPIIVPGIVEFKYQIGVHINLFLKREEQKLDSLLQLLTKAGFRYYIRSAFENLQDPYIQKHGEYNLILIPQVYL